MSAIDDVKGICERRLVELGKDRDVAYISRLSREVLDLVSWEKYKGTDKSFWILSRIGVEGCPVNSNRSNSLVLFLTGLSSVDPIMAGLECIEETLVSGDCPDIDTDFDPRYRPWVKQYVVETFGADNVCSIGTYQTFRTRAVIMDVARVLALDLGEASNVTKRIDPLKSFEDDEGEDTKVDKLDFDELCGHYPELKAYFEAHPEVRQHAEVLRNQVRTMGTHAGGVIISDSSLKDRIPVLYDKPSNPERQVISAWAESGNASELSAVGLVKYDILGLNNLPVISDCVKLVAKTKGVKLLRKNIPIDDREAITMEANVDMVGIFQLESPATKGVVRAVGMDSLNDVAAVTSLIRPGPKDMGMDMMYARRKHDEPYDMPEFLRELTKDTYGIFIYQEQVMKLSQVLCGFTGPEANKLRKAVGKKLPELMAEQRAKFLKGAQTKIDAGEITVAEVEQIFQLVESFAGYGFNKSVDTDSMVWCNGVKKRVGEVVAGDRVLCWDGDVLRETEVVDNYDHGILPAFEVNFEGGRKVVCSIQHKFETPNGKVPLWRLMFSGEVLCAEKDERLGMLFLSGGISDEKGIGEAQVGESVSSDSGFVGVGGLSGMQKEVSKRGSMSKTSSNMSRGEGHCKVGGVGGFAEGAETEGVSVRRVLSARFVGFRKMCDLEVCHPVHNFALANGVITSNSHAVAYSAVSTVEMWLKHNYTVEYLTALINNTKLGKKKHGSEDILVDYANYARRRGIDVLGPDVNRSDEEFGIEGGKIRFSIGHVKNVASSAGVIVANRPYTGVEDFYDRVKVESTGSSGKATIRRVNKKVVESLVAAGAFDSFGTRNEVMAVYYKVRKEKEAPAELTDEQWADKEKEMTGMCLSQPPLCRKYESLIQSKKWKLVSQLDEGKRIMVFGKVEGIRSHMSKAGNSMYIVQFSDGIDTMNFMVFSGGQQYFKDHVKVGYVAAIPLSKFDDGDNRFFDERGQIEVVQP